jgi:LmbE family N-acetylglucosaminyl deacetylase
VSTPSQTFPPLHDLSRMAPGPVLVVAPHPDDEILGCGGAIALHIRRGDPVHVALVTAGEVGGEGRERLAESRVAAGHLGSTEVVALGAPDGAVASDAGLVMRLAAVVEAVKPIVVYAPSPFEMHPDHVATLDATAAALVGRAGIQLLLYEVNTECMASFVLDITPVAAAKSAALEAFASQIGVMDIVGKADARARARTINVDIPTVTHCEAFLELPAADVGAVRAALDDLARQLRLQGTQP